MKKYLLLLFILIFFITSASATLVYKLPNGEAPYCIQWDGNVVSNNAFTTLDQADINQFKAMGFNCLAVDIPAKFVWTKYTGVPANDFNWTTFRALNTYLNQIGGMYVIYQGIYDTTGYWNVDNYTFLDTNFSLAKARYQTDFAFNDVSPTYVTDNNIVSGYDADLNTITAYFLGNISSEFAGTTGGDAAVAGYITSPNEGFANALMDTNGGSGTADLNAAWQGYVSTKYGGVAGANTAWGTAFGAITDINFPINPNTSPQQARDFWVFKSGWFNMVYARNSLYLKMNDTNKFVTTSKLLPDQLYPNGTSMAAYMRSTDLNNMLSQCGTNCDFIAVDPYPDRNDSQLQELTMQNRVGYADSLARDYNIYVYIAENFPTVRTAPDAHEAGAKLFAQMISTELRYPRVKGMSAFTWKAYGDRRDIKDTENATMLEYYAPAAKFIMRYGQAAYNTQIAFRENTSINRALNPGNWIYDGMNGMQDSFLRWTLVPQTYYFNNRLPTQDGNRILINNAITEYGTTVADINTGINNGLTYLSFYRGLENDENSVSQFGQGNNYTTAVKTMFGIGTPTQRNNFSPNFAATVKRNTIITSVAIDQNVFRPKTGGAGDFSQVTLIAGATTDVNLNTVGADANGMFIQKRIGSGESWFLAMNPNDVLINSGAAYVGNDFNANWNLMIKDMLTYKGIPKLSLDINGYYGSDSTSYGVFNGYSSVTGNVAITGSKDLFVVKSDANTFTYISTPNVPASYNFTPSLSQGATQVVLKGTVELDTFTGFATSSMYIDGNLYSAKVPVAITTNTDTSVIIDSNVAGSFDDVNLAFTSYGGKISSIRFVNADRDVNTLYTSGWTNDGNTIYFDVNGIEDTNTTNKNFLTITLDTTAPVTSISGNTYTTFTNMNQTITLTCTDSDAGCAQTRYRIDLGSFTTYTGPFTISTDGNHRIDFNSADTLGNQEVLKTSYAAIDKTTPDLSSNGACGLLNLLPMLIAVILIMAILSAVAVLQMDLDPKVIITLVVLAITTVLVVIIVSGVLGIAC